MTIDNTTARTQTPEGRLGFLAASMGPGGSDQAIEEQERAGQAQLVHSDQLPTDIQGDRADFEAVGFVFGDTVPGDPMFQTVTLPDGWTREGSDHAMWSYIVDHLGRRRASIFYKAAFYDRRADMTLTSVRSYLSGRVHSEQPIVTDDTWATPAAIADAARTIAAGHQEDADTWTEHAARPNAKAHAAEYVTEYTAKRDTYLAIAQQYGD